MQIKRYKKVVAVAVTIQLLGWTCFGQGATSNAGEEPGSQAVLVGQKLKSPDLSLKVSDKSPKELLEMDVTSQGLTERGWDEAKQRYLQISEFAVPLGNSVTVERLVPRLNMANLAMSLVAMQDFCQFLGTKTAFQANLSMGGSPVGRLFMKEQDRLQKELIELEAELGAERTRLKEAKSTIDLANQAEVEVQKALDKSIEEQEKTIKDLNAKAKYGPNTLDRMALAADALIRKLNTNYVAQDFKATAAQEGERAQKELADLKEKKNVVLSEKLAQAQAHYEPLQERIQTLVEQIKEKTEEAKKFADDYVEQHLNTKYNYRADYDIVGLTPIKYYYGVRPAKGGSLQLEVAGAYAWSPALERDTRAILHESGTGATPADYNERFPVPTVVTKPGDRTLGQWLGDQSDEMDTFGMGKWYVDNSGKRYWLGCAYAVKGYGARANASAVEVKKDAVRNLSLSLNVKFQVEGSKEDSLTLNEVDSEYEGKLKQLSGISREGIDIASEGASGEFTLTTDKGQSTPIRYYVCKVAQADIVAAHNAVLQQAENAARAHEARYRREGIRRVAGDHVKASKDDTSPAAKAYGSTKKELDASQAKAGLKPKGGVQAGDSRLILNPTTNSIGGGNVQPVLKGSKSKVPDDF